MIAITRDVSPAIARAELTHLQREPIDYARAAAQHESYRALLRSLGHEVVTLPADAAHPDCVFVEDTAIVLDDLAVMTRPGAESRRGETAAMAEALGRWRRLVFVNAPATIDGGDVLVLGDRLFVGLSARTSPEALDQLRALTGREVHPVAVHGALHLKTAVTRVSSDTLLVNRQWIDTTPFAGWTLLDIDPSEPFAANTLLVEGVVIAAAAFPGTNARLRERGLDVREVEADELAKAEGGVTCCSVLLRPERQG